MAKKQNATGGALISEMLHALQSDIDDESPQVLAAIVEDLLSAGALDAHLTPLIMKKNRPGVRLEVLCKPAQSDALILQILRGTSTLGVKRREVERLSLPRRMENVTVRGEKIRMKVASLDGEDIRAVPEFEDCRAAAKKLKRPLKEILAAAVGAWGGNKKKARP